MRYLRKIVSAVVLGLFLTTGVYATGETLTEMEYEKNMRLRLYKGILT